MKIYQMLSNFCKEVATTWRETQLTNLSLTANAIFRRKTFVLSHLAQEFPRPKKPKVEEPKHSLWHRLKRLRRFLENQKLKTEDIWQRFSYLSLSLSDEPDWRLSILLDLT